MQAFLKQIEPIWRPHPGQEAFLLAAAKIKVLACGRRWGKTDASAIKLIHALTKDYPTRHILVAPSQDQAQILFDRTVDLLKLIAPTESIKVVRTPFPKLTFGQHRLQARSGHLGYALRGHDATHIIVDEAAFVNESLITEIAMPMLATSDGELTLISTPKGHNHFWRFFEMGRNGEHGVWSRQGPSSENPQVSAEFLRIQRELLNERAFQVEYEARFIDGKGQVFKTDAVEACLISRLESDPAPPYSIGIDWARYTDFTALACVAGNRDGAVLVGLDRWQGIGWQEQVRRAAEWISQYPGARVQCDGTGVGDPVTEMLRDQLPNTSIEGVTFTSRTKTELVDGLAAVIDRAAIQMLPHVELLKELQHFEATPSASGLPRLAAVNGFHDDLVCALALAVRGLDRPYRPEIHTAGIRTFD